MTHDQHRAEAARIRDDAEGRLAEIKQNMDSFLRAVRVMSDFLNLSDTDEQRLEDHLEDIESDLFADEIKELQTQIETASDIALEDYEDHISTRGE